MIRSPLSSSAALATALAILGPAVAAPSWDRHEIIVYHPRTPAAYAALRRAGITAGRLFVDRDAPRPPAGAEADALRQAGLRWYVENIATDFYAAYHRWRPGRQPNQDFLDAQAALRADTSALAPFERHPSLADPDRLAHVAARLRLVVGQQCADRPLYYSLADEAGIADLSALWDFDVSPPSLAGFRAWLRGEYHEIAALNAEWGTRYAGFDEALPELTRAALARADGNLAPWSDFKAWMDVSFATAIRAGTDAVHAADPDALAAIEGAQMPGWGGYDYTLLAGAVDAMEVYDQGDTLDIVRSLAPDLILLDTSAGFAPMQRRTLWHAALRGSRGTILWDEDDALAAPDGTPGPWTQAARADWRALRGGLGASLIAARDAMVPVAILYDQESFRIDWLQSQHGADKWTHETASDQNAPTPLRRAISHWTGILLSRGITPRFIPTSLLTDRGLAPLSVLALPRAYALSDPAASAIARFVARGGIVVADGTPGMYDAHGRLRARPALANLPMTEDLGVALDGAGIRATPAVTSRASLETRHYTLPTGNLLAILPATMEAADVAIDFDTPTYAYDARTGEDFGRVTHLARTVAGDVPTVLLLRDQPLRPSQ